MRRKPLCVSLLRLCLLAAGLGSAAAQPATQLTSAGKLTIEVLDPASEQARALPKAAQLLAGNPVVHFTVQGKDSTLQVITNSLIVLHVSRPIRFKIDSPDVVEVPSKVYVFPSGVQGIFHALKPGTATIAISYAGPDEVCEVVSQCSPNWSGYILQNGQTFTGVTAQWTVPTVASNSPNGMSCTWVGIDGSGNNTVLQAGTEQDMGVWYAPASGATYYAWYELFPSPQQAITSFPGAGRVLGAATGNKIEPGDVIQVSITPAPGFAPPVGGKGGQFVIQFTDQTQNWTYSKSVGYAGKLSSAEWIEEATTGIDGEATLANYESVLFDFHDQVATNNGPLGSPHFTTAEEVSMNQKGVTGDYSTPSDPDGDVDGFFVNYSQDVPNHSAPPGPWVETTALPPALLNTPYSQTLVVEGATSPSWRLNGLLPHGLEFNFPQGIISGTPTVAGNFPISVQVIDAATQALTQNQNLNLQVLTTAEGNLHVNCSVVSPVATATLNLQVDGAPQPCNSVVALAVGSHTVKGTVTEGGQEAYKITYAGACNSAGTVAIAQSQTAQCTAVATAISIIDSGGCSTGEHCCDPSSTGCRKCIPAKDICQ
jgi:hypothetical protein